MAYFIVPGYETVQGNKKMITVDVSGPASYANPAGQVVSASDFGWGGFDFLDTMASSDLLNVIYVATPASGVTPATLALRWFVIATGAEVANAVNLSTKQVRLQIVGF